MSRASKYTLVGSIIFSTFMIWGVHFQQTQERESMYQGVLRDDERRKEKLRRREEELQESQRKRALYESVQHVTPQNNNVGVDGHS